MLGSKIKGFLRRIFGVDDLARQLEVDYGFLSNRRFKFKTVSIKPTETVGIVASPSFDSDITGIGVTWFVPVSALGNASWAHIDTTQGGDGEIAIAVDRAPGSHVFFLVFWVRLPLQ